jgi:thymidylate kinase
MFDTFSPKINQALKSGESVIVDRYAFSGVAFSSAKVGLQLQHIHIPYAYTGIIYQLTRELLTGPEFRLV